MRQVLSKICTAVSLFVRQSVLFSCLAGFVELPDGKVLSGSEWGNMLLWDGGLIKVEICKKGNKFCHNGMIEQFFMDEGELMTIGADGFIKVCIIIFFVDFP